MFRIELLNGKTVVGVRAVLTRDTPRRWKVTTPENLDLYFPLEGKDGVASVEMVPPGLDEVKVKRSKSEIDAVREAVASICRIDGDVYGWARLTKEIKPLLENGKTAGQVYEWANWYFKKCNLWIDKRQFPLPGTITTFWGHAFTKTETKPIGETERSHIEEAWEKLDWKERVAYRERAAARFSAGEYPESVLDELIHLTELELFEIDLTNVK